ncbi:MAG: hypothetical protein GF331_07305 [Chitinivibrionales bacterium]|nr:hypothetical protein [Chitinivibrionales bacterium]
MRALTPNDHCLRFVNPEPNANIISQMQYIVRTWIEAQENDGYLGTRQPRERWVGWDAWDHKYVILGLVMYYAHTGFTPGLVSNCAPGAVVGAHVPRVDRGYIIRRHSRRARGREQGLDQG